MLLLMGHATTIYRVEVPGTVALDSSGDAAPVRREVGDVVRGFATPRVAAVRAIVRSVNEMAWMADGSHSACSRVLELADVQRAPADALERAKVRHVAVCDDGEILCDSARVAAVHTRGECFEDAGRSGCTCGRYVVGVAEIMRAEVGGHVVRLVLSRGDRPWSAAPADTTIYVDVDTDRVSVVLGRGAPESVREVERAAFSRLLSMQYMAPVGYREAAELFSAMKEGAK